MLACNKRQPLPMGLKLLSLVRPVLSSFVTISCCPHTLALAAEIDIHSPKTNRRSAGFTEACSGSKAAACIMAELSQQLQASPHKLCAASCSVLACAASDQSMAGLSVNVACLANHCLCLPHLN